MRLSLRLVSSVLLMAAVMLFAGCPQAAPPDGGETGGVTVEGAAAEGTEPTAASDEEIEILCGTSFRAPMEKLVEMFEAETGHKAVMVFGGSEDHLPKVKIKAAGDIYVTHTPYQQYTREAGALLRDVPVGFLAPVLVVAKGNPKGLSRFEDLANEGLQVTLPNPEYSTCGEMVFALLEKKGIKDAVTENAGNALMKHHSEIGNHVKLGSADAGIMWNGVANNFRDDIDIVPLPYEYDEEIGVSVMGLSYTKKKELVEQFLDFVDKHGKEVFAEFGYVK